MFPLGHVTVACGIVWVGANAIDRARGLPRAPVSVSDRTSFAHHPQRIASAVDYRLVALGGLLPDLVDKPLGGIVFRGFFDGNGHLIGHTLLFALLILLPGLYLWQRARDPRLAAVGVADLSHLLVDPVNHSPGTFFWPLLGTDFPEVTFLGTKLTVLEESIAAVLILGVAYALYRGRRLQQFVLTGRL